MAASRLTRNEADDDYQYNLRLASGSHSNHLYNNPPRHDGIQRELHSQDNAERTAWDGAGLDVAAPHQLRADVDAHQANSAVLRVFQRTASAARGGGARGGFRGRYRGRGGAQSRGRGSNPYKFVRK